MKDFILFFLWRNQSIRILPTNPTIPDIDIDIVNASFVEDAAGLNT